MSNTKPRFDGAFLYEIIIKWVFNIYSYCDDKKWCKLKGV